MKSGSDIRFEFIPCGDYHINKVLVWYLNVRWYIVPNFSICAQEKSLHKNVIVLKRSEEPIKAVTSIMEFSTGALTR